MKTVVTILVAIGVLTTALSVCAAPARKLNKVATMGSVVTYSAYPFVFPATGASIR